MRELLFSPAFHGGGDRTSWRRSHLLRTAELGRGRGVVCVAGAALVGGGVSESQPLPPGDIWLLPVPWNEDRINSDYPRKGWLCRGVKGESAFACWRGRQRGPGALASGRLQRELGGMCPLCCAARVFASPRCASPFCRMGG